MCGLWLRSQPFPELGGRGARFPAATRRPLSLSRSKALCLPFRQVPILAAGGRLLTADAASRGPDRVATATSYHILQAWHGACDSGAADGFEPSLARQQKDIAMHTSI